MFYVFLLQYTEKNKIIDIICKVQHFVEATPYSLPAFMYKTFVVSRAIKESSTLTMLNVGNVYFLFIISPKHDEHLLFHQTAIQI